jgi:excisionase family DNA binding protein
MENELKNNDTEPLFMTIEEAAVYLGMPKGRVYAFTKERNFPAIKRGKSWYINRKLLPVWAEKICR